MSTPERYRRFGFEAQRQGASATDPLLKEGFALLAQGWLALADQADWLEARFSQLQQQQRKGGEEPEPPGN